MNITSAPIIPIDDDPRLGSFTITIADLDNPSWFGKFQTGNLSIYKSTHLDGECNFPYLGLIYIISGQDIPELDAIAYALYMHDVPIGWAVSHLLQQVINNYKEAAIKARNESCSTLH